MSSKLNYIKINTWRVSKMNRKERRSLNNSKGGLDARAGRVENAEKIFQQKLRNFDNLVIEKGKEFASAIITMEIMPIMRDVMHYDLNATDEQIAIFEEQYMQRFQKRMEGLGKDEKTDNGDQAADENNPNGNECNEPTGTSADGSTEGQA